MFDAGSIVAHLELRRDEFQRGLREAKAEAEAFEKGGGTRQERVDVDTRGVEAARARLEQLKAVKNANVGVDTAAARAELAATDRSLQRLHRRVSAHVGLDGAPAVLAEIELVQHQLDKLRRTRVEPHVDGRGFSTLAQGAAKATSGVGLLGAAVVGLGPALIPVAGAALAAGGALGGMFVAGGVAAAGFAVVAIPTIRAVIKQTHAARVAQLAYNRATTAAGKTAALARLHQAWAQLTPAQRAAGHALVGFQQDFERLRARLQAPVLAVFTGGLKLARQMLPELGPLVRVASSAFLNLEHRASRALAGPFWHQFFAFVHRQAGPALVTLGRVLGNVVQGIASMARGFEPILPALERGLLRLSASFAHIGQSRGFAHFIAYVQQNGPLVARTVGDMGRVFVDLARVFAQVGPTTLRLVDDVAKLADRLLRAHPQAAQFVAKMATFAALGALFARPLRPLLALVGGVGKLAKVAKEAGVLSKLKTAAGGLTGVFGSVAGKAGIVGLALTALGGGLIYAYNHSRRFRDLANQVAGVFSRTLGPAVRTVARFLRQELGQAVQWVTAHWPEISRTVMRVMNTVAEVVLGVLTVVKGLWHTYGGAISTFVKTTWGLIKGTITTVMGAIKGVIDIVLGLIHGNWGRVWKGIKEIVGSVWNAIKTVIRAALGVIKGVIQIALATLKTIIKGAWDGIKTVVSAAWDGIKRAVTTAAGDVVHFVSTLPGKLLRALGDLGKLLFQAGKDVINGLWNGIKSVVGGVYKFVSGVAGHISGAFKSVLSIFSPSRVFHEHGVALMQGLQNGIAASAPQAVAAIDRQAKAIRDKLRALHAQTIAAPARSDFATGHAGAIAYAADHRRWQQVEQAAKNHYRRMRQLLEAELVKLAQSKTFEKAIDSLTVKLDTLAQRAQKAFVKARTDRRLAALASSPDGRELTRLQAEQTASQRQTEDYSQQDQLGQARSTNADQITGLQAQIAAYKKNLAQAVKEGDTGRQAILKGNLQTLGENLAQAVLGQQRAIAQAQAAIDDTARQRRIDALTADLAARKAAIVAEGKTALTEGDRQSDAYGTHLRKQLAALVRNLEARRISYARYIAATNRLLASSGQRVSVPASTREAVAAGPGTKPTPAPRRTRDTGHGTVHHHTHTYHVTVAGKPGKHPDPVHTAAQLAQAGARRHGRRAR